MYVCEHIEYAQNGTNVILYLLIMEDSSHVSTLQILFIVMFSTNGKTLNYSFR
jgi:hypothetical protein